MSKIVKPWPPSPPPLKTLYADADALADIPARLSADTSLLWTHTTGKAVDDATPQASPLNGSKTYGHDHSGGAFGVGLFRSIATMSFASQDSRGIGGTLFDVSAGSIGIWASAGVPIDVPAGPVGGAYGDMSIRALVYWEHGALPPDVNDTLTFRVAKLDLSVDVEADGGNPALQGWRYLDFPLYGFEPGTVNGIRLQTILEVDGGAATKRNGRAWWHSIEIGVAG